MLSPGQPSRAGSLISATSSIPVTLPRRALGRAPDQREHDLGSAAEQERGRRAGGRQARGPRACHTGPGPSARISLR